MLLRSTTRASGTSCRWIVDGSLQPHCKLHTQPVLQLSVLREILASVLLLAIEHPWEFHVRARAIDNSASIQVTGHRLRALPSWKLNSQISSLTWSDRRFSCRLRIEKLYCCTTVRQMRRLFEVEDLHSIKQVALVTKPKHVECKCKAVNYML